MDKTEALLKHMRDLAAWLEIQAREFDSGHFHLNDDEETAEIAAAYRHKLKNVEAVVQAYNRLAARENKPKTVAQG
jgi:hypothetical protein